ncbi:MAG TPA: CDP-alcohol phosphatidyltransferase family protein [Dehalococcoidia bacterium]|nr:CDP-alcohol phosphatidyltransferase family protein [Dehalococcoidia bacterium]
MPSLQLLPRRAPAQLLDPVVAVLARTGVTPNALSTLGFLGNVGAGAFAGSGWFLAAGLTTLAASALDLFDGALARATGRVTRFGAVYDSVLDRLSEAAVLGGLLYYYTAGESDATMAGVIFAAVVGSVLVSYVRARAQGVGVDLREGLFTRAERVLLTGAALIIGQAWPPAVRIALWALAVLANVTAVQRLLAVRLALREADSTDSEGGPR